MNQAVVVQRIRDLLAVDVSAVRAMHGGSIAQVLRLDLTDGRAVVAKVAAGAGTLDIEGDMLTYLAEHTSLPVPAVLYNSPNLLIMAHLPGDSNLTPAVQRHAADLLAELHRIQSDHFGFGRPTLIGGLNQPNPWTASWVEFFSEHRLLAMATEAARVGRLPSDVMRRVAAFADRVGDFIDEPSHAALIHGDMWTTNVLAQDGRVTGFIDPAIYFAHPEIELAFSTLFGTFGEPFFDQYQQHHPIAPGFFEQRRDVYNLYPLLVHVRLFGGSYVASVQRILSALGF